MHEKHVHIVRTEELDWWKTASQMTEERRRSGPWAEKNPLKIRMEQERKVMDAIGRSVFAGATVLCFVLGFLVEKWRRGKIHSVVWALDYGFLILFGNLVVCLPLFVIPKIH